MCNCMFGLRANEWLKLAVTDAMIKYVFEVGIDGHEIEFKIKTATKMHDENRELKHWLWRRFKRLNRLVKFFPSENATIHVKTKSELNLCATLNHVAQTVNCCRLKLVIINLSNQSLKKKQTWNLGQMQSIHRAKVSEEDTVENLKWKWWAQWMKVQVICLRWNRKRRPGQEKIQTSNRR